MECVRGAYLDDEFLRVIEVSSDMRLAELHSLIQDLIGFADEHIEECFIATRLRGKKTRLGTGRALLNSDAYPEMHRSLAEIFPAGTRKKLFYSFDFGDNWIFEIKKKSEASIPNEDAHSPRVVQQVGGKPI